MDVVSIAKLCIETGEFEFSIADSLADDADQSEAKIVILQ